jgi:hypothetical protein
VLRWIEMNGRSGSWYVWPVVDSAVIGAGVVVMPGVKIVISSLCMVMANTSPMGSIVEYRMAATLRA